MPARPQKPQRRQARQQRAQDTVEVIVRATAQILSREGAARLTTNRVAERAGVSIGSLYQYFANKEALIAEVRRRYDDRFRERLIALAGAVATRSLHEAIAACVQTLIDVHRDDVHLHNAISAAGIGGDERRLFHQLATSWLDARRDEVRRPDRALAAVVALDAAEALIHGVALREPERLDAPAFAAEVTDLLVRYLARDDRPDETPHTRRGVRAGPHRRSRTAVTEPNAGA